MGNEVEGGDMKGVEGGDAPVKCTWYSSLMVYLYPDVNMSEAMMH